MLLYECYPTSLLKNERISSSSVVRLTGREHAIDSDYWAFLRTSVEAISFQENYTPNWWGL